MAITNNDVLVISEPVEKMYTDCTSQLIINLARHLGSDKELATAQWEIKKLSELDAITDESIQIIAANTGKAPTEIRKAITEGLAIETKAAEKTLQAAAAKGVIMSAANGDVWETSQGVKSVITNLTQQAVDDANIVNTVMLQSTLSRYVSAVQNGAAEEVKLIEQLQSASSAKGVSAQLAKTQAALNSATMSVAVGAEARTTAVRRVIKDLAAQGITGYIDKAGHHWSPEAYINMDIRTTVHNAAVQGQRARSADYGVTTFQMSSHAGARPLCAPYQGGFYSWDNTSGVVEDLYGNKHKYIGINKTSYGEPAGVFGINCGHFPQTFVSGFSVPRYSKLDTLADEAENAEQYRLSQRQRYMERNIRKSKTEALAYKAAGDDEAFKTTAVKIVTQNAKYKAFCAANNLTPRVFSTEVTAFGRDMARQVRKAATQAQAAKQTAGGVPKVSKAIEGIVNSLRNQGVEYKSVGRLKATTEELIIDAVAGGDKTGGSCASAALAYVGRKNGYDVLDFRGGQSREWFGGKGNKVALFKAIKANVITEDSAKTSLTNAKNILKKLEVGKQYYFSGGRHAAIIRKVNNIDAATGEVLDGYKYQYLELQSPTNNGWKDFLTAEIHNAGQAGRKDHSRNHQRRASFFHSLR